MEKFVEQRCTESNRQYHIRGSGYGPSENRYEPAELLPHSFTEQY